MLFSVNLQIGFQPTRGKNGTPLSTFRVQNFEGRLFTYVIRLEPWLGTYKATWLGIVGKINY